MGYTFYRYLAFIQPGSDADLHVLKSSLEEFYAKGVHPPSIRLADKTITVAFDSYNFFIHLSDEPHVIKEAIEIADDSLTDWNDKHFNKDILKISNRRFEMWGERDDDMDYFNDSLFIVGIIEQFNGITVFNIS